MKRTAIFVDAGYLYAQGSASLNGSKVKRESLQLVHGAFLEQLRAIAGAVQPNASLLRIYWYDGTSRGPTLDHRLLADLDDVKLRLGFINSVGQQKGVDSLLVTDLVELSRNGAICDACYWAAMKTCELECRLRKALAFGCIWLESSLRVAHNRSNYGRKLTQSMRFPQTR